MRCGLSSRASNLFSDIFYRTDIFFKLFDEEYCMGKLKPVQERIRYPLDADYSAKAQKKIDNFFLETKNYLEDKFGKSPNFEIISQEMELSNNRLTYLIYNDKCVAGVFERRTEFNNLEYIFFRELSGL